MRVESRIIQSPVRVDGDMIDERGGLERHVIQGMLDVPSDGVTGAGRLHIEH
jgi:hypothetical protein